MNREQWNARYGEYDRYDPGGTYGALALVGGALAVLVGAVVAIRKLGRP